MKKPIIFLFLMLLPISANAVCTGRMVNPITDLCWDCIFPISIGAVEMPPSNSTRPDTENFPSPICVCPKAGIPTPGIAVGMWEPIRMVDVTKRSFCFSSIGGITIDPGLNIGTGTAPDKFDQEIQAAKWHLHWYINPLTSILGLFKDSLCGQSESLGFDIAYMTEFDPLWNNDLLAFILNPEAILFGNPVAALVCAADCIASTVWKPLDPLFWCAGCQGTMYPFTGNVTEHNGSIQSSSLMVERFTAKLHRQLMAYDTSGAEAICFPIIAPIIKKSQYRLQTTIPIPGIGPFGCNPYGKSTLLHESFKEIPIVGEDFGYFVWRKRNCCAL
jgi:conjugal transfer pilus assembly protein TraU